MAIPYQIRIHPRARHIRLRVDPRDGVVVTVPRRFDCNRVAALVAESQDWIRAVQRQIDQARAGLDSNLCGLRPARIDLPALNERWPVRYLPGSKVQVVAGDQELQCQLPDPQTDEHDHQVAAGLRAWLAGRARQELPPRVEALAERYGFSHGRISIRHQRSRWGSCSATGNLSLNARLLLCSPAACRYVLVHELVHTEHHNHSRAFWERVRELVPDYRERMGELTAAVHRMPEWLHADRARSGVGLAGGLP